MPDCKQYGGITRDELGKLRQDLAKEGINVPAGDDVSVKGPYGIESGGFEVKDGVSQYYVNKNHFGIADN